MANAIQPATIKIEQGKTNFGGTTVDGNRVAMIGFGSWFQTQDATAGTNLTSPQTVTTGTVVSLVVPSNAVSITIIPKTNSVQVSEVSGTSSLTQYCEIPAGMSQVFPVARQNNVYLLGVTGSSVVNFYFTTV